MRAFISGCAGFIGRHLVRALSVAGADLEGVDDLSRGFVGNLPTEGLKFSQMTAHNGFNRLKSRLDTIYHLAGRLSAADVLGNPLKLLREHYADTIAACRAAQRTGATLVLCSSSEVYGWNQKTPFAEDDPTTLAPSLYPRAAYAVSKLHMEHTALAFAAQHKIRVLIARLFNVAGAGQRPDFGLPIFARAALRDEPIQLHGGGVHRRSFTHVSDVVEALTTLAVTPAAIGQVVNVGVGLGSIRDMRTAAVDIMRYTTAVYGVPREPRLQFVPYPEPALAGMAVRVPDTAKLTRLTGITIPDRWQDVVRDVCDDQAARLKVLRAPVRDVGTATPVPEVSCEP